VDQRAIEKAGIRLHAMRRALGDLAAQSTPLEFSSDWYVFVTAANGVYEVLKKGVEHDGGSSAWVEENVKVACEADPLLKYMFEARNDDEHGLAKSVKHMQTFAGVFVPQGHGDGVVEFDMRVREDGTAEIRNVVSTFKDVAPTQVEKYEMVLAPVTSRRGQVYDPPTVHRGAPLEDKSPLAVARLTYSHLEGLVSRARELV
jgi:hypothetical protein